MPVAKLFTILCLLFIFADIIINSHGDGKILFFPLKGLGYGATHMQHENNTHFEIERRFLIRFPQADYLAANAKMTEIVQTYLLSEKGETNRVRKRGAEGVYEYTHTIKRRISSVRRIEQEQVITEEEYVKLLKLADPQRRTIEKERWCLDYLGQTFEIDIFPFWRDRAIMELELRNERQEIIFPPQIEIIKEITDDGRYTNAALAKSVPYDEI